jgi:shikimate kinase
MLRGWQGLFSECTIVDHDHIDLVRSARVSAVETHMTKPGGNVVLIGPIAAGKSTLGNLLSAALGLPHCSLDEVRFRYYGEIGYDESVAKREYQSQGFWGLYRYWKPFEAHAVERVLEDHPSSVIDFGAGHSVYEDDALMVRVKRALAPCRHVVLVLPSPDLNTSLNVLRGRRPSLNEIDPDINEHFITHPSNYALATITVYTDGRLPEDTCAEIVARIIRSSAR